MRIRLALLLTFALIVLLPPQARASVSIAVAFEALVKESSAVAIVTPVEQKSVWENGRIYTYSRVHADNGVAGELNTGDEAWVRTMGGVVGHIGQLVDGEAVLTVGRPSLVFLRQGPPGSLEVTARAQGQYALTLDDTKTQRFVRSGGVGVLLPPKTAAPAQTTAAPITGAKQAAPILAQEMLHNKRVEDGLRDIGAAWKRLHASK
jgi:hypothetical protein